MGREEDLQFGEAAVARGFITKAQLEEGLKALAFVTQAGLSRTLGAILAEKGLITEVQAAIVERAISSEEVKIIAGFELLEKLGEGGMGAVYKARQISMDRLVALKTLSQQLAQDEEFTARFIREARTAAMLDHVNIIRGLDVGSEGDVHYFAMEFVEGESVGGILERDGKMPEDRALHIIIQVARALECAWTTKQIIHRDIKPDNILVTKGDIAKVADLGLAKTTDNESTMMTRTGVAMGTPHYISPEQARGEKNIDIRTDIYSLGATLYHMLVGAAPFSGSSAMAVITKHLTEPPVPAHVANPDVSEALSSVVGVMMQKEPAARYADPAQLLEDLELVADGKAPKHAAGGAAPAPARAPSQTDTLIGTQDLPPTPAASARPGRGVFPLVAGIVGALAAMALLVGAIVYVFGTGGKKEGDTEKKAQSEIA
ncbi:MAG: serine/threonine-protein kinase, partial [Planctomycetota bacterium]